MGRCLGDLMIIDYKDRKDPDNCILHFTSDYCKACKRLEPILESSDKTFIKIDVEEYPSSAMVYHIMSLPTILQISNSQILVQFGAVSQDLLAWIEKKG